MTFEQEPSKPENDYENLEKPELQESEIKELLDAFRDELENMPEYIGEMNAEMFLGLIGPYEQLGKHQNRAWEIVKNMYGFDINNVGLCSREYSIKGTPGTSAEGTVKVSLYKTNNPDIFIGQYDYPDGDKWWSFRPDKYEHEI